jgi:hypothetical protein
MYYNDDTKELIPVLIISLSGDNFWYWKELNPDLTLGETKHGYGNFYKPDKVFDVEVSFNIKIK